VAILSSFKEVSTAEQAFEPTPLAVNFPVASDAAAGSDANNRGRDTAAPQSARVIKDFADGARSIIVSSRQIVRILNSIAIELPIYRQTMCQFLVKISLKFV
jgi:hypothetical protein